MDPLAEVIASMLGNAAYEVGDRPAVQAALAMFQIGQADFADCLIAVRDLAAGCRHTATFDRAAARLDGMQPA